MPGYRYKYTKGTSEKLYKLMKKTKDVIEYRKIQTVYLRSKYDYSPKKISEITGLSIDRIRHIHSDYNKDETRSFESSPRGGRNHSYMSLEEENKFLSSFKEEASKGAIVEVKKIHKAYEQTIGKKVHKSMIYKLLHNHGWLKIMPRPKHLNQNVDNIETFKKTFIQWLPMA